VLQTLAFSASVTGILRSVSALNCRRKPARMPYSCDDQFGTSGNNGWPIRRAQECARHSVLDPPFLDVEDNLHRELLAAGQRQFRPVALRLIGDTIAESHGEIPVN
jgi:hypothetical protein